LQIIDKKTAPPIYFPCACAGNFQDLKTNKFCYIFGGKCLNIGRAIDKI